MLIETTLATVIETIVRSRLTEVAFDGRDTLLQQTEDLRLIPADGLGIGEIEDCIFHRHTTISVLHMQSVLDNLGEETVLRGEIRQLPQAGMETVFC